jgi:hypothetical protein
MRNRKLKQLTSMLLVVISIIAFALPTTSALIATQELTFDLQTSFKYDETYGYLDGVAAVLLDGKGGFIDKYGTVVVPLQYDDVSEFHEGKALVTKDNITAIIDRAGNVLATVPGTHQVATRFSDDGLAAILGTNGLYGFVSTEGTIVVPEIYPAVSPFSEGLAAVQNEDGYWGVIDTAGEIVIDYQYASSPHLFVNGITIVTDLTETQAYVSYIIDKTGTVMAKLEKGVAVSQFSDGWALCQFGEFEIQYVSPTGTYLEVDGVQMIGSASVFNTGYAWILALDSMMTPSVLKIDSKGEVITRIDGQDANFVPLNVTADGITLLLDEGGYGFIDDSTLLKSALRYPSALPFSEGHAAVMNEEGKWGFIVPKGNKISSWAGPIVEKAIADGFVPLDLQSNYTSDITRQEFCRLAITTYETLTGGPVSGRVEFNDTTDEFVEKAGYLEIIAGVGDGNFDPDSTLTRQQAAVILAAFAKALDEPIPSSEASFSDNSSISDWALEQVGQVQSVGIMNGVSGKRFSPKTTYTREQSIATMVSLVNYILAAGL